MTLTLTIESFRNQAPVLPGETRFGQHGGIVGRAVDSDLVLPDPGKLVSRRHARIDCAGGAYRLTVLARNPIAVNGRRLDSGEQTELQQGDQLAIGEYRLAVQVDGWAGPIRPRGHVVAMYAADPLLSERAASDILELIGVGDAGEAWSDPLGLEHPRPGMAAGSAPDHAAPQSLPMDQAFPAPGMWIPDNYDPMDGLPRARPDAPPAAVSADDGAVLRALLRGLGLPDAAPGIAAEELAQMAGQLLRQAVSGAMALLAAPALRVHATRPLLGEQETWNNPLAFFGDADSALSQMLLAPAPGFIAPDSALASVFDAVRCHEAGLSAGLRAAAAGVLAHVGPARIEAEAGPAGMPMRRQQRLWKRSLALHASLSAASGADIEQLCSAPFCAAYDAAMWRAS